MRVAMFYAFMDDSNAHGKLDRRVMAALAAHHDVTVFATSFDNPDPDRIDFVRVPVPRRPLLAQFLAFHVVAPVVYGLARLRGRSYDVVHFHDVDLLFGDVSSCHFCNTSFLRDVGLGPLRSIRQLAKWLEHRARAALEPLVFRRVGRIVVPSEGLAAELEELWGEPVRAKTTVIPNHVAVDHHRRPADHDRSAVRAEVGIPDDAVVAAFVALGHYERKGLPELVEALATTDDRLHVLVVGGSTGAIAPYLERARDLGVAGRLHMVPTTPDIRPFLWASDLLAFPTRYETFSLVAYEAAAAGLPVVATPVHGIAELVEHGVTGLRIEATAESVAAALTRCLDEPDLVEAMGRAAAEAVTEFGSGRFAASWMAVYDDLQREEDREITGASPDGELFS